MGWPPGQDWSGEFGQSVLTRVPPVRVWRSGLNINYNNRHKYTTPLQPTTVTLQSVDYISVTFNIEWEY